MNRMMATAALAGALLLLAGSSVEARRGDKLNTSAGVLTMGGRFAFELEHDNPDVGGSQTGVTLNFSPSFGGFPIKNLLLEGALAIGVPLADFDGRPKVISFAFGLQYLFNFRSIVVPYVGFRFGPYFIVPDRGDTAVGLAFQIPAGILIALNEHVAMMVGTELSVAVGVAPAGAKGTQIKLPIGYLGVSAFF